MPTTPIGEIVHLLRGAEHPQRTDAQLLASFVEHHDEAAIATLVQRHAVMVWGVCRRVLGGKHHDAEDAFQATFLVLVRRAASIASPELLSSWLYGVALQTASRARAMSAKRCSRERQVSRMPEPEARQPEPSANLETLLDGELSRLPQKYRAALILCDLQDFTRKEAARQLGVPEGTVAAWLSRGRAMLAKRLLRRGWALPGAMAVVGFPNTGLEGVPASVVSSTIRSATNIAAGQALAETVASPTVVALIQGVLKTMMLSKILTLTAVLLLLAMAGLGGGLLAHRGAAPQGEANRPPARSDKADADTRKKKADAIKKERKRFVGTWQLIRVETGDGKKLTDINKEYIRPKITHLAQNLGVKTPDTDGVKLVVVYDPQGKWKVQTHGRDLRMPRLQDGKVVYDENVVFSEGTSTLELSGKLKTMDQTGTGSGSDKAFTQRGIYEFIDDDRWRVCLAAPGKDRPTSFAMKKDDGHIVWVFQRIKEDRDKKSGEK